MDYTHLGRTGLKVSRLALGAMNFGELTDEATSFAIMDEALDAGINLFDTADVYGGPQSPDMEKGFGTSEEIIGRWLALLRPRRVDHSVFRHRSSRKKSILELKYSTPPTPSK
jgi:aryl-alcohol dehydrogenase-like predicted oxidoreductase